MGIEPIMEFMNTTKGIKIFLGIAFFLCVSLMVIILLVFRRGERRFQAECVEYDAVIAGYHQSQRSGKKRPSLTLQVYIEEFGDNVAYHCSCSQRMNSRTHPRGTKVRVALSKKKFLGADYFDIRLLGENAPAPASFVTGFLVFFILLFSILAIVFTTLAVLSPD